MQNPVVVITGSSSGLGLATARALLARGAKVVLSSEAPDALQQAYSQLRETYREQVLAVHCDVRNASQVQSLLEQSLQHFAGIDCWINNAGTTAPSGPVVACPVTDGQGLIDVNIAGCYYGSIAALRYFQSRGHGRLINISGRGEKSPTPDAALYASSKAWIRQFSLTLAKEERNPQIHIGTFNPGLLYTPLTYRPRVLLGSEDKLLKGLRIVMRLIGDNPERAAQVLCLLATGERRLEKENRSRRLAPLLVWRLLSGQRAAVDVDAIQPQIITPQRGPLLEPPQAEHGETH